jgi:hypothetical protein
MFLSFRPFREGRGICPGVSSLFRSKWCVRTSPVWLAAECQRQEEVQEAAASTTRCRLRAGSEGDGNGRGEGGDESRPARVPEVTEENQRENKGSCGREWRMQAGRRREVHVWWESSTARARTRLPAPSRTPLAQAGEAADMPADGLGTAGQSITMLLASRFAFDGAAA